MTEIIKLPQALLFICNMKKLLNYMTKTAHEMCYIGPRDELYKIRGWLQYNHSYRYRRICLQQGNHGDYIEVGLTDEDIKVLIRNELKKEEQLLLK